MDFAGSFEDRAVFILCDRPRVVEVEPPAATSTFWWLLVHEIDGNTLEVRRKWNKHSVEILKYR